MSSSYRTTPRLKMSIGRPPGGLRPAPAPGSYNRPCPRPREPAEILLGQRQAEVGQVRLPVAVEQDVAALHVAVDQPRDVGDNAAPRRPRPRSRRPPDATAGPLAAFAARSGPSINFETMKHWPSGVRPQSNTGTIPAWSRLASGGASARKASNSPFVPRVAELRLQGHAAFQFQVPREINPADTRLCPALSGSDTARSASGACDRPGAARRHARRRRQVLRPAPLRPSPAS